MRRSFVLLLIVLCTGCKDGRKPAAGGSRAAATTRATVVTIRTNILPENKTYEQTLVIADGIARHTGELDSWRLFDTNKRTVTFVDDAAGTLRTESMEAILARRRAALANPLPAHYPIVNVRNVGERKPMQGVSAEQVVIEAGEFRRELWLGRPRAIPAGLFAMMHGSETPSSPLAPMTRATDDVLARTDAFPLMDRVEVPFGDKKLIVERTVTSIAERDVPKDTLAPPRDYRDVTPKPASAP